MSQLDNKPQPTMKIAVLATFLALLYLDKATPDDQPATLEQITSMRGHSMRSSIRHLNRLENEGYIRRVDASGPGIIGRPVRFEIVQDIPQEVLDNIPAHELHEPRTKTGKALWEIMQLYLDVTGPLVEPVDRVVRFARKVLNV